MRLERLRIEWVVCVKRIEHQHAVKHVADAREAPHDFTLNGVPGISREPAEVPRDHLHRPMDRALLRSVQARGGDSEHIVTHQGTRERVLIHRAALRSQRVQQVPHERAMQPKIKLVRR
jgi:hypothetical protein